MVSVNLGIRNPTVAEQESLCYKNVTSYSSSPARKKTKKPYSAAMSFLFHVLGLSSCKFRFTLLWCGAFLSLAPILQGAGEAKLPELIVSTQIHDVEVNRDLPKYNKVAGQIYFFWKPTEFAHDFTVGELKFLNNDSKVEQTIQDIPVQSDGLKGVAVSFRGTFESHNNFSAYPFNIMSLPVIFKRPAGDFQMRAMTAQSPTQESYLDIDEISASDSYSVIGKFLKEGTFNQLWSSDKASPTGNSLGLYLEMHHKPLRTSILVILPLLVIWGITYSSQWWKEESAASRGIMASVFAAAAISISSINLQPNVSCPTSVVLGFLCYYLNLFVLGVLTVMAFREKTRANPEAFRRIRLVGRIFSPCMLFVSLVFLVLWILNNRPVSNDEWLINPQLIQPFSYQKAG